MSTSGKPAWRYSLRIQWSEEDQVYLVEVPELVGCTTHGRTYEEAIAQVQEAMDGWIYGHQAAGYPVPPPEVYPAGSPTVGHRAPGPESWAPDVGPAARLVRRDRRVASSSSR